MTALNVRKHFQTIKKKDLQLDIEKFVFVVIIILLT